MSSNFMQCSKELLDCQNRNNISINVERWSFILMLILLCVLFCIFIAQMIVRFWSTIVQQINSKQKNLKQYFHKKQPK